MILLAAATWFYLLTYEGDHPILGPMTKQDCIALKGIRARMNYPPGACIPARQPR